MARRRDIEVSRVTRNNEEMGMARAMLIPFVRTGYRLILLASTAKVPIEKGWQQADYRKHIRGWLVLGGIIVFLFVYDVIVL